MGMDVYGNSGNYFRNNVWWWRPLADYVLQIAPDIASDCERWHSNNGDGLNGRRARELADVLDREIATGNTALYATNYKAFQNSLPDHKCDLCDGTGVRTDEIGHQMRMPTRPIPMDDPTHPRAGQMGWCNGCNGTGRVKDFNSNYPFDVENVKEFAEFCRASDGFRIC